LPATPVGDARSKSRVIEESDMKAFCRLLGVVFVFVTLSPLIHGQALTSESKVKIKAEANKPDAEGKQTVTIHLDIDKGWHLYANPVGNKDSESSQTVVNVKAGSPLKSVKIDYPAGKLVKDTLVGDYKVYEDKVVIKAHVQRASGDDSPLQVILDIQACDKNNCLQPSTVKLTVK